MTYSWRRTECAVYTTVDQLSVTQSRAVKSPRNEMAVSVSLYVLSKNIYQKWLLAFLYVRATSTRRILMKFHRLNFVYILFKTGGKKAKLFYLETFLPLSLTMTVNDNSHRLTGMHWGWAWSIVNTDCRNLKYVLQLFPLKFLRRWLSIVLCWCSTENVLH